MSEKKGAGLNKLDMQAVIAAFVLANGGRCDDDVLVSCDGEGGRFPGTPCPLEGVQFYLFEPCALGSVGQRAMAAKEWLDKYHQQKAEASEAEKRKGEAAKNKEQEAKKTCGECQHIYDADGSVEIRLPNTTLCHKKSIRVPIEFTGCRDFEPMATGRMTLQSQHPASGSEDAAVYAERISQLKKEESEMAWRDFNSMYKERERLRVDGSQRDIDLLEITAKCERLTEQRNRLSNSLVEAMRRVKEVEQENNILAKKLVDCTAKRNDLSGFCVEKGGLIDRLRNANSRSTGEMYRAEAELKDERRRKKEIEKENGALRSKLEQAAEDRKRLEEQLSESKQTLPPPMYLYAMGVTAEEFLAMKGRFRQR